MSMSCDDKCACDCHSTPEGIVISDHWESISDEGMAKLRQMWQDALVSGRVTVLTDDDGK